MGWFDDDKTNIEDYIGKENVRKGNKDEIDKIIEEFKNL